MAMFAVYISYRRADSADIAGRIYDRMVERYGAERVYFQDLDAITPDFLYANRIAATINQSTIVLAIIGPRWFNDSSAWNRRYLDNPGDHVRIELETALNASIPVIPVLVGGASMPPSARLPRLLQPLHKYNAIQVHPDPDFQRDMGLIFAALDYWLAQQRPATASADGAPVVPVTPLVPTTPTVPTQLGVSPPTQAMPTQPALPTTATLGFPGSASVAPINPNTPPPAPDAPLIGPASDATPQQQPFIPRRQRRMAPVLAIVGLTLVVALLAGLLYTLHNAAVTSSIAAANARHSTQTAQGNATLAASYQQTVSAQQTQGAAFVTATAMAQPHFPYFAAAPGPGCDTGNAPWVVGSGKVTCGAGYITFTADSVNPGNSTISWSATQDAPFPQSYTTSIQVRNITAKAVVNFNIFLNAPNNSGAYEISETFDTDFGYVEWDCQSFGSDTAGQCPAANSVGANSGGTRTLSITVNGAQVTCSTDGQTIGSVRFPNANTTSEIAFHAPVNSASAQFLNFSVKPI